MSFAFLRNLFGPEHQDKGSIAAHIAGLLALLAATPGGQEFLDAVPVLAAKTPWTLVAYVTVAYFLGARAGQPRAS